MSHNIGIEWSDFMLRIYLEKEDFSVIESADRMGDGEIYCDGRLACDFVHAPAIAEVKRWLIDKLASSRRVDCECLNNNSGIDL